MQKETNTTQPNGYCKAAGCRLFRTINMESISRDLDSKWEALASAKTAFMTRMEENVLLDADAIMQQQPQELPPNGEAGNGFIAEARDWRFKNCAVKLYRRYFSPDMYFIFPLIVNQQAAVGLDFTSCITSIIFGTPPDQDRRRGLLPGETPAERRARWMAERMLNLDNRRWSRFPPRAGDGPPSPFGSTSWRIHDAEQVAASGVGEDVMMLNGSKPFIILEVLFIAVWDTLRGGDYGSALVAHLEAQLLDDAKQKSHKAAWMYVEIGFEQPLAKKFWGNNGFAPVVRTRAHTNLEDLLPSGVTELEDWQLGFVDRRCLRFNDTKQYAKRVLVD